MSWEAAPARAFGRFLSILATYRSPAAAAGLYDLMLLGFPHFVPHPPRSRAQEVCNGEQIMGRANTRHGRASAQTMLMRGLLFPQTPSSRTPAEPAARSGLLHLVVPGADDFVRHLAPEIWPLTFHIETGTRKSLSSTRQQIG